LARIDRAAAFLSSRWQERLPNIRVASCWKETMAADASPTDRTLGIALVAASAIVFAFAGVLTKSIAADPPTILCWRGLFGSILVGLYVLWRNKSGRRPESLVLGRRGWALAIVGAVASVAFVSAFKFNYVANVTIIYATVPFAAAALGWLLLGEGVRSRTMLAAALSLAGVSVMVFSGLRTGHIMGDGLALVMTLLSALYIVMVRMFRDAPVVWAGAVSAFILFVLGWFVTDPLAVTGRDMLLLVTFGASFAIAVVLWTEGARLVPAAEAALLGIGEVPCAILLAWLFLAEIPPRESLAGGAIVLAAVFWHAGHDWRVSRIRAGAQPG
jgi:drug/metabolite transporter (DMT)-like permease